MNRFRPGDDVRVDIPDKTDPDFDKFHDRSGEVIDVLEDDTGETTGDERDDVLYRVRFNDGETMDFRWRDLHPA